MVERLGIAELVKLTRSGLVNDLLYFLRQEGEGAQDYKIRDKNCDMLLLSRAGCR